MNIYIKNNNIYYKDYKILDGSLSIVLIPIALIIILHNKFIKYFSYVFLCIAIIGTIDTYFRYLKYKEGFYIFILIGFLHLLLLYPLINIKKYIIPNIINYLLGLLGILITIFLPYWPYSLSRKNIILLIIIIYILVTFLYKFYSKSYT